MAAGIWNHSSDPLPPCRSTEAAGYPEITLVFSDPVKVLFFPHSSCLLSCSSSRWNINSKHIYIIHLWQLFTDDTVEIRSHSGNSLFKLYISCCVYYIITIYINVILRYFLILIEIICICSVLHFFFMLDFVPSVYEFSSFCSLLFCNLQILL